MCLPFPGRVTAVDAEGATVLTEGRTRRASSLVVPDVRAGDWVLVASGTILRRLDPDDAAEIAALGGVAHGRGTGSPARPNRQESRS
jgi:hydrogenase assembly chaperone HypC/HupF